MRMQIAKCSDLSENFEYKCAKRDKNRNDSRIRYLQQMVRTAKVIQPKSAEADCVGLFDTVVIVPAPTKTPQTIRIVTTLRQDALKRALSATNLRWPRPFWAIGPERRSMSIWARAGDMI